MSSREKRASLSSGMLTSRDIGSSADVAPVRVETAEAVDGGRRAAVELTPPAVLPSTMLSRKGSASAAGFRPEYWSYDRAVTPPPAQPAVVPLFSDTPPRPVDPAVAETAAPASPAPEQTRPSVLILGLGCIAVILSTSLYWASGSARTGATAEAPTAAVIAARPAKLAPAPVAVAKEVAPAAPEVSAAPPPAPPAETVAAAPPHIEPPVAPAPKDPPAPTLSSGEIDSLIAHGEELLATGDIVAARLYFQRAAEQGSGPAATEVGKTFDPLFLEQSHARGIRGDAATAATWYRKAIAAGDHQAQIRLDHLTQRFPG